MYEYNFSAKAMRPNMKKNRKKKIKNPKPHHLPNFKRKVDNGILVLSMPKLDDDRWLKDLWYKDKLIQKKYKVVVDSIEYQYTKGTVAYRRKLKSTASLFCERFLINYLEAKREVVSNITYGVTQYFKYLEKGREDKIPYLVWRYSNFKGIQRFTQEGRDYYRNTGIVPYIIQT